MKQGTTKVRIEDLDESIKITVTGVEHDLQQEKLVKLLLYNLIFFAGSIFLISKFANDVLPGEYTLKNVLFFIIYIAVAILSSCKFLLAFKVFIWQIAGEEIYEAFPDKLHVTKSTFKIGKTREYRKEDIAGIEVESPKTLSTYSISKFSPIDINATGLIVVRRNGKLPLRLGMGLRRHDAVMIVREMKKKLLSTNE